MPLQHVPADRDRRRGVQAGRPERRLLRGRRRSSRAGRTRSSDPRRSSSSRPSATAIETLGGALADVEGVAEAYSVTGEWDFVAILRVRDPAEVADVVTHRFAAARRDQAHADDGRLRGVLPARPRGAVLDRDVVRAAVVAVIAAAALAGCGGDDDQTSSSATAAPPPSATATPSETPTATPTPTPSATEQPSPTATQNPEDQPGGAGDEEAIRVPAEFTIARAASRRRRSRCPRS